MTFWNRMWALDAKLRRFIGLYLVTPLFVLSIPVGLGILWQSSLDYRRLEQHQVATVAVVQSIAQTGGRQNRNAVTATFKAADGRTYVSKALYGIEGSKHVRPGMSLGVVYENGRPTNNAPTLSYAQAQVREMQVVLALLAILAAVLTWVYWRDYAELI